MFLLTAPDDNEWLVRKAITIVATHGLLRKQEIVKMSFDDLKIVQETGDAPKYYEFTAHRGKQRGPKNSLGNKFHVIDPTCVKILDLYVACFKQVFLIPKIVL
jgi:hypothetical protein